MTAVASARLRGLAGRPVALSRRRGVASATLMRLAFFVGYFALNALFAADKFVVALTFPIFLICCFNVARIPGRYATVEDMLWLLMYVFFVIAPCQTLRFGHIENEGPVTGLFFTNTEIATAFVIIFVFLLAATVTNILVKLMVSAAEPVQYRLRANTLPVLLVLSILGFVVFVVAQGGMGNVLADRHSKELSDDGAIGTAGASALALQLVACLLVAVYAKCVPYRKNAGPVVVVVLTSVALALLFVAQNPYNTARFYFLIAWFPIVMVFISGKLGIKTFYLSVLVGLVVVMPVLNLTSRSGASLAEAISVVDLSSVLTIPGLDVLDMLVYEVRYLELSDFFWGGKTLGLVLFFVPRSIWTGKETVLASDMGVVLADLGTAGTPNLSGFVAGDFYADLGLLGVVIGATMVSFLLTFFGTKRAVLVHGLDLRAFVFMASAPILVRGSLGAVIGLTFIEMIILAIMTRILCRPS